MFRFIKRVFLSVVFSAIIITGYFLYDTYRPYIQNGEWKSILNNFSGEQVLENAQSRLPEILDFEIPSLDFTSPLTEIVQVDAGKFVYGGLPQSRGKRLTFLKNTGFITSYDEQERNPYFVCYRLFRVINYEHFDRPSRFSVDRRTMSLVSHNDYTNSGFDRGHLAPNFAIMSRYGRKAQIETFKMSNIVPQNPNLNRFVWRDLESIVANKYANIHEEIWVITGVVYDFKEEELDSGIEIPDYYYKIITDIKAGKIRVLAFLLPENATSKNFSTYLTSVDKIERLTRLDFFPDLPKEDQRILESWIPQKMW